MNCSFCAAAGAMNAVARTAAPATPKSLSVIVDLLADRASQERIAGHCSRGKHLVYEAKPRLRGETSSTRRNLVYEAKPRLRGETSSTRRNLVYEAKPRLRGETSSTRRNLVYE